MRLSQLRIVSSVIVGHSCLGSTLPQNEPLPSALTDYRPDRRHYNRIDSLLDSAHPDWKSNNAFHGTLQGDNMIEKYEVYANPDKGDIICLIKYGRSLNGHAGIMHGGITALTFDNSFGWLFLANKTPPAFTANISVNYRS
jgi:hypothetical protein